MEKNITLDMTKKLKLALEKMGYTVGETRPGDSPNDCPVELINGLFNAQRRPAYVNGQNADYFISVHCNAFDSPSASGTRIFYSEKSALNYQLATNMQAALSSQMGNQATLHTGNLAITRESAMPTVLIETGFLTNQNDLNQLLDPAWQDQFVCAIAKGLDAQIHSGN